MTVISAPRQQKKRCCVCKTRLKVYEGKLCSCSAVLCMRHRFKADHCCPHGKRVGPMEKVEPKKVETI